MNLADTPYRFEFAPAPADLAPYLNALFVLHVGDDGVREMLPAYSGQVILAVEGAGRMDFGNGMEDAPGKVFCTGPMSCAWPFEIDGPAFLLGASLNFNGWAAMTRLPAASSADQFVPIDAAFGAAASEALTAIAESGDAAKAQPRRALDHIEGVLRDCLTPLPERHRSLVDETYRWLSSGLDPQCEDLFANIDLSQRQIQRLVKRFFGLSPSRLKRRYRAIRAATILSDPDLSQDRREAVLDAFYDQAHLIREIREFTGRTPRLLKTNDTSFIGDTLGKRGYGVQQLFAGEVESRKEQGRAPHSRSRGSKPRK